ncbi:MAG: flagellar biosynthesis protein FlhA [Candidatus Omnitrophica bacterium]|nr:flagellar biosynthesis protein FlhA [Candidatus Omnitrophota bacterium]
MAAPNMNAYRDEALAPLTQRGDVYLAAAIIGIMVVMLVPLPFLLLDALMALNLALSLVVLLLVVYSIKPLEFSSFPTLLLIITMFRMALNVASTRLILLNGSNFDGRVIKAFGNFVVGGNYVVGTVLFLILVVIQFVVITKGAQRVAEVAARFTLDAMPGKQMAIDADLNAGILDEQQAIERRKEVAREGDFYGAMDGASKFVRGDSIAGIIITVVNIVGGLIIGVLQQGMPIAQAAKVYMLLTIGDGLVTQLPSLLISTASGILVTRAGSVREGYGLGKQMTLELLSQPRGILATSIFLLLFALIPGLPKIPFFIIAILVGMLANNLSRSFTETAERGEAKKMQEQIKPKAPESVDDLLRVDPLELEIGYGLIELVDSAQGGDLPDRITTVRRQCASELGIIVPPIRIRDNMQLQPNDYVFKLRGHEIGRGAVMPGSYLAMNPDPAAQPVPGVKTAEPSFGLPAYWITEAHRVKAETLGYTVVNAGSVVATHLIELIKKFAYEIIGRQEVRNLLDNLKKTYPALVEEIVPGLLSVGQVQKVLQNLLRERVPVRDLVSVLEVLGDYASRTKDTDILTEYARHALSRIICRQYMDERGKLRVITLDPQLEEVIQSNIKKSGDVSYVALEPAILQEIIERTAAAVGKVAAVGAYPVILCTPHVRMHFKRLTERTLPNLAVLSYNEVDPNIVLDAAGMVEFGNADAPLPA